MRATVETTCPGCGVSRVLDGAGALLLIPGIDYTCCLGVG